LFSLNRPVALTVLKALTRHLLISDGHGCPIPPEELSGWLDDFGADNEFRLYLLIRHFNEQINPTYIQELVQFVNRTYEPERRESIYRSIWERSKYSAMGKESLTDFISILDDVLVSCKPPMRWCMLIGIQETCKNRILKHPVAEKMKGDQDRRAAEIAIRLDKFHMQ